MRRSFWIGSLPLVLGILALIPGALTETQVMRQETGSLKYQLVALFLIWSSVAVVIALGFRHLIKISLPEKLALGAFWLVITLLSVFVVYFLAFSSYGTVISGSYQRWVLFFGLVALIANLTPRDPANGFRWTVFFAGLIWFGSLVTMGNIFRSSVRYPFRLSWSEGNRFWDYSVLFGRHLYNYPPDQAIPAYIDIGRQSLWGLPFLFGDVTIQGMRFWNAVLFSVPYALFGWLVFWRGNVRSQFGQFLPWFFLGLWVFLFIYQAPIYTPLVICAMLVALALRLPLLPALLLVGVAGYYAQLSRYTWMFAPAIWAGVVSLAQVRPPGVNRELQRWSRAVGLGLSGLAGGFGIPRLVSYLESLLSQNQTALPSDGLALDEYGIGGLLSRQPLLWERLLPNSTFDLGILLALVLAAGPLVILTLYWLLGRQGNRNTWQKLAVSGMAGAFLLVGLVVSVKIGGGSNLHNMDMFLLGLIFLAAMIWHEHGAWHLDRIGKQSLWVKILLVWLVVYPLSPSIRSMKPLAFPATDLVAEAMSVIQRSVAEASQQGDVLFIDHRQLLTFGYIRDVPLIPEYEKKRMMDEAMSGNETYFEPFYRDLMDQRFRLIISEPLQTHYQNNTREFSNENDSWVYWVSLPVLCYYEPMEIYEPVGVELLVPRQQPCSPLDLHNDRRDSGK